MPIDIADRSGEELGAPDISDLLSFAIQELGIDLACELSVILVNEAEMSDLHIKWMDESGPTDVLSFPMDEIHPHTSQVGVLGDIVLCPSIALSQAVTAGHSFGHELSILSVHGLLHIVGYDHVNPEEEKTMFDLQESLVNRWAKRMALGRQE